MTEQLTLLQEDFPVRTYQRQEKRPAWAKGQDQGYGLKSSEFLAKFDPDTSSLRMSQTCLVALLTNQAHGCPVYSATWPKWGIMLNGTVFPLPSLGQGMNGTEFGSLPTPIASDNRSRGDISMPSVQRRMRIGKQIALSTMFVGPACPMCAEIMMGFPEGWSDLEV